MLRIDTQVETEPKHDIDVLFVSERPLWPADQGFRIHGPQMARALVRRGLNVRMASLRPTPDKAPPWLRDMLVDWPASAPRDIQQFKSGIKGRFKNARKKVLRHQALDVRELAGVIGLVEELRPKVVIGLGQHAPVMLRGLRGTRVGEHDLMRLWYAADEPVSFQLSCLRRDPVRLWKQRLRLVGMYGMLERLFATELDGAIGVSPRESQRLRYIGGMKNAVTIRNGVDLDYFTPRPRMPKSRSLIFWGNMSFEPNVDAVCWFANHVWPTLQQQYRGATWKIVGSNPCAAVQELNGIHGIDVLGQVSDIRPHAREASAVILPMRCGHGIKNKLLEAAAMGLPILVSKRAVQGLAGVHGAVHICRGVEEWVNAVGRAWEDHSSAASLGWRGRKWVELSHDWAVAAEQLLDHMEVVRKRTDKKFAPLGERAATDLSIVGGDAAWPMPAAAWTDDDENTDAPVQRKAA